MNRLWGKLFLLFVLFICSLVSLHVWIRAECQDDIDVQDLLRYRAPSVPFQFNQDFRYSIDPADKRAKHIICDGRHKFLEVHRNSWRQCLVAFYEDSRAEFNGAEQAVWRDGANWPLSWLDIVPPGFDKPNKDGWNACVSQLNEKLRDASERELRISIRASAMDLRQKHRLRFAVFFVGALAVGVLTFFGERSCPSRSRLNPRSTNTVGAEVE